MTGGISKEPGRSSRFRRLFGRRQVEESPSADELVHAAHPAGGGMRRRSLRGADELVADVEAFLEGRYAERLEEHSLAVPPWAWTNLLAHGDDEAVQRAARGLGHVPAVTHGWWAARGYLASEMLRTAGRGTSLSILQHDVLVPLELDLARRREAASWTPQQWVATVRIALRANRHTHQT